MRDLNEFGLKGRLPVFIDSFLSNTNFRVGTTLSDLQGQEEGIPLGSILSVTLFSFKISNIVKALYPGVDCSLYVDDILYARHLTDVLWYGAVRPSVRSVVHNPCGQDITRTIWPRMLILSVYSLYGQRKKPIYFQGQRSNFKVTGPFKRILALGSL